MGYHSKHWATCDSCESLSPSVDDADTEIVDSVIFDLGWTWVDEGSSERILCPGCSVNAVSSEEARSTRDKVSRAIELSGTKKSHLSKAIGLQRSNLSAWLKGGAKVGPDKVAKLRYWAECVLTEHRPLSPGVAPTPTSREFAQKIVDLLMADSSIGRQGLKAERDHALDKIDAVTTSNYVQREVRS